MLLIRFRGIQNTSKPSTKLINAIVSNTIERYLLSGETNILCDSYCKANIGTRFRTIPITVLDDRSTSEHVGCQRK